MGLNWTELVVEQADWHWQHQLRPRLAGLTDEEYRWEPAAGVTTIAWRIGHLVVSVFGVRVASHFGGPRPSYPGDADTALAQLDTVYQAWIEGVQTSDLSQPCGPASGLDPDKPLAAMVLHVHRELIHHGAEIALLRDLWLGSSTVA